MFTIQCRGNRERANEFAVADNASIGVIGRFLTLPRIHKTCYEWHNSPCHWGVAARSPRGMRQHTWLAKPWRIRPVRLGETVTRCRYPGRARRRVIGQRSLDPQ